MEITDIRIVPVDTPGSRLRAYVSVTFDRVFVVRDIRIIDGKKGRFVAMPSRRIHDPCPSCGFRNPLTHTYCGSCGAHLPPSGEQKVPPSQQHKDLAHPITTEFREYLQSKILEAYERMKQTPEDSSQGERSGA